MAESSRLSAPGRIGKAPRQQSGFVLAMVLWIVAGTTLLAGMFHGYIERQVAQAVTLKQRVEDSLALEATAATVRYLLATRRTTLAGLTLQLEDQRGFVTDEGFTDVTPVGNELRLDGRPYKGLGNIRFSIQDMAGLLGLNSPSAPEVLREILSRDLGPQRARELAASLADYIDENTWRRINGAEAGQYTFSGLPGPTNWYLRTATELSAVLGWPELLSGPAGAFWRDNVSISYANNFNINTASVELLAVLLDIDMDEAGEIIAARERYPFRSLQGVISFLGVTSIRWPDESFRFYPAPNLRIKLWCEGCKWITVQSIQLTENGFYGPWLMYYNYRAPGEEEHGVEKPAALVPGSIFADPLLADRQ